MDAWVEVCHEGLQFLTLFKRKIVYLVSLFKTRDLILDP